MSEQTESAPDVVEGKDGKPDTSQQEGGQAFLSQEVMEEYVSKVTKDLEKQIRGLQSEKDKQWSEMGRLKELLATGVSGEDALKMVEKEKQDIEAKDEIAELKRQLAELTQKPRNDAIAETLREAGIDPASEEAKRLAMEHKDATSLKAALFSRLLKERKPASEGVITQGNTPQKRSTDMEKLHAEYVKEMKSHVGKSDVAGLQARTKRKFRREGLNV